MRASLTQHVCAVAKQNRESKMEIHSYEIKVTFLKLAVDSKIEI